MESLQPVRVATMSVLADLMAPFLPFLPPEPDSAEGEAVGGSPAGSGEVSGVEAQRTDDDVDRGAPSPSAG